MPELTTRKAVRLTAIRDGGTANKAGLKAEDILLFYGATKLLSPEDLTQSIGSNTGKSTVTFIRDEKVYQTEIEPGKLEAVFVMIDINGHEKNNSAAFRPETQEEFQARFADALRNMVVTTAPSVDGFKVSKQLGVISAECVFGMNFFRDFFSAVTDIFGGRSAATQQVLRDARETCLQELKNEALARGANAVIAVDLDYSEFSGQGKSMLFLVASGTAVFIEPIA